MSKYPAEWTSKPLGEIYPKIVVGYVGNVNDHYCSSEEGVPFYRTLNIRNGFFRHSEHPYVTHAFNEKNKKSQIKNNDILIARVGANLGMVCKAEGIDGLANMANAIIIKTNDVTSANADFYTSFLLSPMGKNQIFSGAAGGAQGVFNTKLTQEIMVPVPPLPEQSKIALILSTWGKAIGTTEKLIETSKQQKKALMQQLLTGKKRLRSSPKDGAETGKVFEGEWEEVRLKELATKIGSGVTPKGGSSAYKESGIPLIRSQNVLWGKLDLSDVAYIDDMQHQKMKGSTVKLNDVLLNITGASIGRVSLSSLSEANVNQHVCIIRCSEAAFPAYLKLFLLSFEGQKQIEQCQAGGNRQGLNFEQIKSFKIKLPAIKEQQKIASVLTAADKEIEILTAKLTHFKREKKALMQQLLTGKRRVKIDEVEAA